MQQFQVATRSTSSDMTTVFHTSVYGRFIETQSNHKANNFALSDAEDSTSDPLNRGGIADLFSFIENTISNSPKVMDSFVSVAYASLAASTGYPVLSLLESQWKLRQQHDQNFPMEGKPL